MPATIVITCPSCKKQGNGPAELQGKKIKCKSCGEMFTVGGSAAPAKKAPAAKTAPAAAKAKAAPATKPKPAPKAEAKPPPKKQEPDESGENPYMLEDVVETVFRCPQCAMEMDDEEAVICLNCGYNIATRTRLTTIKTYQNSSWDWIKWLGPATLCAILSLGSLGGIVYLWTGFKNQFRESYDAGSWAFAACIWGSVVAAAVAWFAGKFAFKRFKNPVPPETVKYL